jgi:hypothetical protein
VGAGPNAVVVVVSWLVGWPRLGRRPLPNGRERTDGIGSMEKMENGGWKRKEEGPLAGKIYNTFTEANIYVALK